MLGKIKEPIQGGTSQGVAEQVNKTSSARVESPTGPQMDQPDLQVPVALPHTRAAPTGPPAALIAPPKSPI